MQVEFSGHNVDSMVVPQIGMIDLGTALRCRASVARLPCLEPFACLFLLFHILVHIGFAVGRTATTLNLLHNDHIVSNYQCWEGTPVSAGFQLGVLNNLPAGIRSVNNWPRIKPPKYFS